MKDDCVKPIARQFGLRSMGLVVFLIAINLAGVVSSERGLLVTIPLTCGLLAILGHRKTANAVYVIAVLLMTLALIPLGSPIVKWLIAAQSVCVVAMIRGNHRVALVGSLLTTLALMAFMILWWMIFAQFLERGVILSCLEEARRA